METVKVTFHKLIQDSQEFGSDNAHMVSRIFFSLDVGGKRYANLYVDIKQVVGGRIEDTPLEVGQPQGYPGPFDHEAFSKEVENYFRSLVGLRASGIGLSGGSNIRMQNNILRKRCRLSSQFPLREAGSALAPRLD